MNMVITVRCTTCRKPHRIQGPLPHGGEFTCLKCLPPPVPSLDPKEQLGHQCHAIGCSKPVAPYLLMCARHWHMVPRRLQLAVWAQYQPSQEITKKPSANYLVAARDAINAIAEIEGRPERLPMPAQEGVE